MRKNWQDVSIEKYNNWQKQRSRLNGAYSPHTAIKTELEDIVYRIGLKALRELLRRFRI